MSALTASDSGVDAAILFSGLLLVDTVDSAKAAPAEINALAKIDPSSTEAIRRICAGLKVD